MNCFINGKTYIFSQNIRGNDEIRKSFNNLATKTFGLSFEYWYQNGYWTKNYVPYVLMDGDSVVANVSVNIMDCIYDGQDKRFIQLGTIMTDTNYRNMGLSRFLMEKVLDEWLPKCDGIYLYANDSVTEFYPHFGFEKPVEFQHFLPLSDGNETAIKLNMNDINDVELLLSYTAKLNNFSVLSLKEYQGLLMFYCTQFMKENIYYCKDFDAVVIADFDGDEMLCYEIFGGNGADINDILLACAKP